MAVRQDRDAPAGAGTSTTGTTDAVIGRHLGQIHGLARRMTGDEQRALPVTRRVVA